MNELYPCRFCGEHPIYRPDQEGRDIVECESCYSAAEAVTIGFSGVLSAKIVWQRRNERFNPFIQSPCGRCGTNVPEINTETGLHQKICVECLKILEISD